MKFNSIKIEESITNQRGIKGIEISRLSNVVALVGKNGSGKTRILDIFNENLFEKLTVERLIDKSVTGLPQTLNALVKNLEIHKDYFLGNAKLNTLRLRAKTEPTNVDLRNEIATLASSPKIQIHPKDQTQFNQTVNAVRTQITTLKQNYLRRIKNSEIQVLQAAITANTNDSTLTFENLIENVAENNPYNEFASIHKSGLRFLAKLPQQLTLDYMDSFGDKEIYEAKISHKRYLSLKKLVKDFLNKDLTWEKKSSKNVITETGVQGNYSGEWKLNNRNFNYAEFSDGEKTLFTYALLFFLIDANPKLNIKNSIILIDEPELHLHPESEINLITGIRNAIGENGQLIFATHSINILSSLNYDEIFMVKNGIINHPSQAAVGESLSELMGLEDRIDKLSNFLSSIATWTFVNFMAECFTNPEVISSAKPDDPQLLAFKEAITDNSSKESNLLLDFGAGKGRVYEQIKFDYEFIEKVTYSALEPNKELHQQLKTLGATNIFSSHNELPPANFDFILLCNVLHEIPIVEWSDSLNAIINALKSDGYLIIIEAKILTKGEKIGKEGFILLDIEELQTLFSLNDLPTSINIDGKHDIITCAVFPKASLNVQITNSIILRTLKLLQENTLKKLIELRDQNIVDTIGIGRKNAFLSQLYINSQIAQMNLKKK